MNREKYISTMENVGFPSEEAVKMADCAILDFGGYDAAYEYYMHDAKFRFSGWNYAGHRKARRVFQQNGKKKERRKRKMPVDVKDLPPAYQAQALRKWAEQERRKGQKPLPCPAGDSQEKPTKYHNKPTERVTESGAVLRFDSQKEARRYDELAALERGGEIRELRMQVDFTLQEAYTDTEGRRVRAIRYRADFTYRTPPAKKWKVYEDDPVGWSDKLGIAWDLVVEDVKSRATRTKEYAMKRKMMKDRFNIDIQEV